jgi:hypothetical protein
MILAVPAIALWGLYLTIPPCVPLPVFAIVALPVAAVAVVLAVGRRDGVTADRLAVAALRHLMSPGRLVPAPEGVPAPPAVLAAARARDRRGPAPLVLPVADVDGGGVIDLGRDGAAMVLACSSLNDRRSRRG